MKFELTPEQVTRMRAWCAEQDEITRKKQIAERAFGDDAFINKILETGPYYGAIGGELTFSFTPNSISQVEKVTHAGTGATLDLTDYDSW